MPAPRGWTLFAEYSDSASGQGDRRPDFQAALPRCGSRLQSQSLAFTSGRKIVLSGHTAVRLEDHKIVEEAV